jgi:hypothetical protein
LTSRLQLGGIRTPLGCLGKTKWSGRKHCPKEKKGRSGHKVLKVVQAQKNRLDLPDRPASVPRQSTF